jgi:hypothetical protein
MLSPEILSINLGIDFEVSNLIFEAEKKHGYKVHMVIEPVFDSKTNKQYGWWVEFENDSRIVETFEEMEKYFLEDMVAKGDGPVVECEDINESDSYEIMGVVDD